MSLKNLLDLIEDIKLHRDESLCEVFDNELSDNINLSAQIKMDDESLIGEVFCCDNLHLMDNLIKSGYEGKFQMIYLDPPFFSNAKYFMRKNDGTKVEAYSDIWPKGFYQYLEMVARRIEASRKLLKENGLIWVHLDYRATHYIKIIMDELIGKECFVNEIIWRYKSGGASTRHFARKHDTILVYGKTKKYDFYPMKEKSYNRNFSKYNFKGVEEFQDEKGWYTLVNMKDVWDIPMVGRTSSERTGYATQKPEELLRRIVLSSTKEEDLCGDFFAGSGTLGSVCKKNNRRFILCDRQEEAYKITMNRI
ncbi:DNA-methyltransferase [Eubacteriales bacterium KG127]